MTTLIDRIMNKIEIDHTGKWAEDMIAIKKIIEAELTAVKGVDELIDECLKFIDKYKLPPNGWKLDEPLIPVSVVKSILEIKDLNQTPVASECKHECDKYVDADGVHCERCTELIEPTTEEQLKDSQQKEVNIKRRTMKKL